MQNIEIFPEAMGSTAVVASRSTNRTLSINLHMEDLILEIDVVALILLENSTFICIVELIEFCRQKFQYYHDNQYSTIIHYHFSFAAFSSILSGQKGISNSKGRGNCPGTSSMITFF